MLVEYFTHDLFALFVGDLLSLLEEEVGFVFVNNVKLGREGVADIVGKQLLSDACASDTDKRKRVDGLTPGTRGEGISGLVGTNLRLAVSSLF